MGTRAGDTQWGDEDPLQKRTECANTTYRFPANAVGTQRQCPSVQQPRILGHDVLASGERCCVGWETVLDERGSTGAGDVGLVKCLGVESSCDVRISLADVCVCDTDLFIR